MLTRAAHWATRRRFYLIPAGIILSGSALRVMLVRAGWPGTDSDDSTMGLMALHILTRGAHPIFFYGQSYMGAIEAYVAALMFGLLGVSEFALKCALIALYACFMVVMYVMMAQAFCRRWALVSLVLLGLGADDMLYHELEAYGGYLETLLFGALMVVLSMWLIDTDHAAPRRSRPWVFGAWALAAGIGLYSDPLVAPFVALSGTFLLAVCWHDIRSRAGLFVLAGLLLGLSPWIIYDVTAPSLAAAKSFAQQTPALTPAVTHQSSAAPGAPALAQAFASQALGVVVISLPNNSGATAVCSLTLDQAWPPQHWTSPHVRQCIAMRGIWGGGVLVLLGTAIVLEARSLRTVWRERPTKWSRETRRRAARNAGRLIALVAPAATIVLYAGSSAAATAPWQYSRYLISMLIALPVLLATLWEHTPSLVPSLVPSLASRARAWVAVARPGIACLTGFFVVVLAVGMLGTFGEVGTQQATNKVQQDLARTLVTQGDTRIYSEFWTCYRTIFLSHERVLCSVLNADFSHRPSRYAPYDVAVSAAPHVAYVFPLATGWAATFPRMAAQHGWRLQTTTVDEQYVIFRVLSTAPTQR